MPTINSDNPCVVCGSTYSNAHQSRSDWCLDCGSWLTSRFLLKSDDGSLGWVSNHGRVAPSVREMGLEEVLSRFDVEGVEKSDRNWAGELVWKSEFVVGFHDRPIPFQRELRSHFSWVMPSRGDWWRKYVTGLRLGGVTYTLTLVGRSCSICGEKESARLGLLNSDKVHAGCVSRYEEREADPSWRSFKYAKARMHAIARGYGH